MARYLGSRLLLAIPTVLAVLTLVFFVVRVIPGDPAQAALGDYASQASVDALRERMGLNEPLIVQYFVFLGDLLRGDLGKSMITGKDISELIRQVLPFTLELTFTAIMIGTLLGVPIGIYSCASCQHLDRLCRARGLISGSFRTGFLFGHLDYAALCRQYPHFPSGWRG